MSVTIYIAHAIWNRLTAYVTQQLPREAYAIVGCGLSSSNRHTRFLGKALYVPEQSDYEIQAPGQVRVTPDWFHAVLRACVRHQHHPILVHSHISSGPPAESHLDFRSTRDECPAVAAALRGVAIGEMIVNRDMSAVEAHVFNRATGDMDPVDMVMAPTLGTARLMFPTSSPLRQLLTDDLASSRLQLAFGPEVTRIMRACHFAVVGAGSLGEPIVAALAKLEAETTLVDTDTFAIENERRSIYGSVSDARQGRKKVHTVRAGCLRANPEARIHVVEGDIRDLDTQEKLRHCHAIVTATDNVSSRLVSSHLAMVHGLLMFDVGTGIDVADGRLTSVRGQVMKLIPGLNLCHECADFLDLQEGRIELGSEEAYEFARSRGYVRGADMPAPSVMSINMQFAGLCVWEIQRYFCGATPDTHSDIVAQEFIKNTMSSYRYGRDDTGRRANCPTCSPGMVFLGGDQAPLMSREVVPPIRRTRNPSSGKMLEPHGEANPTEP